jgi:hypothetical protein
MIKLIAGAALAAALVAAPAAALMKKPKSVETEAGEIVLYDGPNYSGRAVSIDSKRMTVSVPFNIKSIGIYPGEKWRVCAKPRLKEPCLTLTESVPVAAELGIHGGIGSAEPIKD